MTIWRVCSPCCIPKGKDMYSEYVKVIAFPLQQWMQERASVLRYTYITFLIIHSLRSCPIFYSRNVRVTGFTGKRASKCFSEYSFLSQYLTNLMNKICFTISFISCLYMFRAHVLTYRCDDTRGCAMQFWSPDNEHMCSKHVEAWNKTYCETNFVHQFG